MKTPHITTAITLLILFNLFGIGNLVQSGSNAVQSRSRVTGRFEVGAHILPEKISADHNLYLPIVLSPSKSPHQPALFRGPGPLSGDGHLLVRAGDAHRELR
jgi:hypothetical protein